MAIRRGFPSSLRDRIDVSEIRGGALILQAWRRSACFGSGLCPEGEPRSSSGLRQVAGGEQGAVCRGIAFSS